MNQRNEYSNIPLSIEKKIGLNLHNTPNSPICILKNHIYTYFQSLGIKFAIIDDLSPFVDINDNFDALRIPVDHPSRSKSDTYYVNTNTVLRTHTSAHQNQILAQGITSFLVTGDVYRKDEIDSKHYNIFHQMECVHICESDQDPKAELMKVLNGLVKYLFPTNAYKILDDYFPFTDPSFQVEVEYGGADLEILGCGIIHREILDRNHIKKNGYAIGFGLERLAMIFFDIPDIRLFWSTDPRVCSQFKEGQITRYKPVPFLESITKDISFWLKDSDVIVDDKNDFSWTRSNDFCDIVRNLYGDDIEEVKLLDKFFHKKTNFYSHTYRLKFRPCLNLENPSEFTKQTNERMKELEKNISGIIGLMR